MPQINYCLLCDTAPDISLFSSSLGSSQTEDRGLAIKSSLNDDDDKSKKHMNKHEQMSVTEKKMLF